MHVHPPPPTQDPSIPPNTVHMLRHRNLADDKLLERRKVLLEGSRRQAATQIGLEQRHFTEKLTVLKLQQEINALDKDPPEPGESDHSDAGSKSDDATPDPDNPYPITFPSSPNALHPPPPSPSPVSHHYTTTTETHRRKMSLRLRLSDVTNPMHGRQPSARISQGRRPSHDNPQVIQHNTDAIQGSKLDTEILVEARGDNQQATQLSKGRRSSNDTSLLRQLSNRSTQGRQVGRDLGTAEWSVRRGRKSVAQQERDFAMRRRNGDRQEEQEGCQGVTLKRSESLQ